VFLRNIAIFSVVDVAGLAIGLLTSPITTRLLTLEQYGATPLLNAVWSIATIVQFAGMDSAFIMYQARRTHDTRTIIVTSTIVATAAAGLVWLLFALIGFGWPWLSNYAGVTKLELAAFMLWILPNTLGAWHLQLLRFMHQAFHFAKVILIGRILSVLVAIPVMYMLPQEVRLAACLLTYAACSVLSLALAVSAVRTVSGSPYARQHYSAQLVRPMITLGASLIPGALVYSLCSVTDRLLLGWYSSTAEVAVFSLAGSVAGVALVLKLAFSRTWDPHMVDWLATREEKTYLPRLQAAADIIAPLLPVLTLLALAWGDTLFRVIFPAAYAGAGQVMPVLVLAGTLSTLALIAIATETISGKARYRLPLYAAGLIVNAAVCIAFIPRFGAVAAAYGNLAGEVTILFLWAALGKWVIGNLKLKWTWSCISLAIAVGLCASYKPGTLIPWTLGEQLLVSFLCVTIVWALARYAMKRLQGLAPVRFIQTTPITGSPA
jgi:O-antigen/teichoic acid export membrane protein